MTDEEFEMPRYHKPEIMHAGAAEAMTRIRFRNDSFSYGSAALSSLFGVPFIDTLLNAGTACFVNNKVAVVFTALSTTFFEKGNRKKMPASRFCHVVLQTNSLSIFYYRGPLHLACVTECHNVTHDKEPRSGLSSINCQRSLRRKSKSRTVARIAQYYCIIAKKNKAQVARFEVADAGLCLQPLAACWPARPSTVSFCKALCSARRLRGFVWFIAGPIGSTPPQTFRLRRFVIRLSDCGVG